MPDNRKKLDPLDESMLRLRARLDAGQNKIADCLPSPGKTRKIEIELPEKIYWKIWSKADYKNLLTAKNSLPEPNFTIDQVVAQAIGRMLQTQYSK